MIDQNNSTCNKTTCFVTTQAHTCAAPLLGADHRDVQHAELSLTSTLTWRCSTEITAHVTKVTCVITTQVHLRPLQGADYRDVQHAELSLTRISP
jgi:hypothetical protein